MKYLTLIRAVALLHQHQRPIRTTTWRGKTLEYIEATPGDIAIANRLAATHLPVPGSVLIDPKTGQPINVNFHVDQRYPFEDVTGFANHIGSIGQTLFNDVRSIFTGLVDHGKQ